MRFRRAHALLAALSLCLVAACGPIPDGRDSAPRATPSPTASPSPSDPAPDPTGEDDAEDEAPRDDEPGDEAPDESDDDTSTPDPTPSPDPSPDPTKDPSPDPTPEPSPDPTPEPTPDPTPDPDPSPDGDSRRTDARGFTVVTPSADSRTIYVSSSRGSDDNDCLTEANACKTLKRGTSLLRRGHPDHLYLRAGDAWRNEKLQSVRSGRSTAEPAVVTSYGEGARPRIEAAGKNRSLSFNTGAQGLLDSVSFIGLHFQNVRLVAGHPEYTGKAEDGDTSMFLGGHKNILLEDNIFDHHKVVFQEWEGNNPTNISVRRNIFTGAYVSTSSYSQNNRPSNMYLSGINGLLLEQNAFDHGGWHATAKGAGANMYNHNVYAQYSDLGNTHVVRENFFTRASSHGIQMRSGGVAEDNFFGRNAIAMLMGYGPNKPLPAGTPIQAHRNVVTEGQTMIKGHDHCQGNNLCTTALWGLEINPPPGFPVDLDKNIIHSRTKEADTAWREYTAGKYGIQSAAIALYTKRWDPSIANPGVHDNISWQWNPERREELDYGHGNYPDPGRTLGDYYQHLRGAGVLDELVADGTVDRVRAGSDDFESFLNLALNRSRGQWDDRISAPAVNDYIRAGFGW